ncbi:chorismate synthase [Ceraceosorus guamensis]|uniref:Chorismate synthase n=1 Tax=Ceraceosorus guamensis TaxID=1522189 RepID=A0A316VWI3_9BASI|nr:chorismate synthase [Ceraceosorus guamensis]PWN39815.1 chorismate synthase [Ceraceosorus guamensis]
MSSFGTHFRVTTFGESHCRSVGAIVDGCPPGLDLNESLIQAQLRRRRPGQSALTTPRDEKDQVAIQSGVERGVTLGTPICMLVQNMDQRPHDYKDETLDLYPRPSHADYTYLRKYGVKASSGGGRSSARETIGRVAGAAIAEQYLKLAYGIECVAFVSSVGPVKLPKNATEAKTQARMAAALQAPRLENSPPQSEEEEEEEEKTRAYLQRHHSDKSAAADDGLQYPTSSAYRGLLAAVSREQVDASPVRCPDEATAARMTSVIEECRDAHDSIGGTVTCVLRNVPPGLGEPAFDKLEATLAHAMLSIPATKGFEFGSGFDGAAMRGSQHNDKFVPHPNGLGPTGSALRTETNWSGGIQGGISNGEDIYFTVAFKPAATISQEQETAQYDGSSGVLVTRGRHDPCVLPRAVPIVESMAVLAVMDALMGQLSREGATSSLRSRELDARHTEAWDALPSSMRLR